VSRVGVGEDLKTLETRGWVDAVDSGLEFEGAVGRISGRLVEL